MEVPRLGVESEPQLRAYTTATAMRDPSLIWDLHHSSGQRWILNPLSKAGDRTFILMDAIRVVSTEPRWELQEIYFFISLFIYGLINQSTYLPIYLPTYLSI